MQKKNLEFAADITFEGEILKAIHCEIVFPETQDEKVLILAKFSTTNNDPIPKVPFIFSLNATTSNILGDLSTSISASKVYNLGISTAFYDMNRSINTLRAEPVDLRICEFLGQDDSQEKIFHFWLTQSILLAPDYSTELRHNGNITIDTLNTKSFEVFKGLQFNFVNYYTHYDDTKRQNIRFSKSVLAAEFTGITAQEIGEATLPDMDEFLTLVSFAERRSIVCYGYGGISNGKMTDFYRGDLSVPKEDFGYSLNETLINIEDFQEFILKALPHAKACVFRDYLFDAIGKTAYRKKTTLESEYLSYYSALENLVNGYHGNFGSRDILENESWKRFSKDLKTFIKKHEFFKKEEDQEIQEIRKRKRELMYSKISELKRVSFGTAFKSFCDFYGVDLSDLWPLEGGEVSTSLSVIRNKLIHGERF